MAIRSELLGASDETIDDAVTYADPMALRGLLYQLTGDEAVAATKVDMVPAGFFDVTAVIDPDSVAVLRAKAAALLKSYRDRGAGEMPVGPVERLQRSIGLTAGTEIPDHDLEHWTEQLALHPWARALEWPGTPDPEAVAGFSVAVIGAGMGGLNAAIQLQHAGIPYVMFEKNSGVGGTWYENRYPGARVDTPSRGYTHIFGVDFPYPNPFCPQSENSKYFNWVADTFDIRDRIEFDTEVKSIIWDDTAKVWDIQAVGPDGPRSVRVNAVISSVGYLSRANIPDIAGAPDFAGELFHSSRWPHDLDMTGKRVAVIGSGCSSYQMVPEIVKQAARTDVYQRTPSWCFDAPGYLAPFAPQVNWLDRNLPYYTNFMRFRDGWLFGPEILGCAFDAEPEAMRVVRDRRLDFMKRKFADRPDLLEKMLPEAPPMSSRPVLVDEDYSIYDVLLRETTELVTDPIQRITPGGIRTEDGVEREYDVIVYATGFKANEFLWPMEVQGRGGLAIEELWARDGARAYLGAMLPGFPNFFMNYGPNTNLLGVAETEEMETRFALECMAHLILTGKKSVDVTTDGYWRFNDELDKTEATKIYSQARVTNYYQNEHGRSPGNCPFDARKMWHWLRDPSGNHPYAGRAPRNADSAVRPYFGQDLVVE